MTGEVSVTFVAADVVVDRESMYAGLISLSTEMTSRCPLMSSVKCLSVRLRTLYGPLYGCCRAERVASCRTNTCVHVFRKLKIAGTFV